MGKSRHEKQLTVSDWLNLLQDYAHGSISSNIPTAKESRWMIDFPSHKKSISHDIKDMVDNLNHILQH